MGEYGGGEGEGMCVGGGKTQEKRGKVQGGRKKETCGVSSELSRSLDQNLMF